jgi:DNA-binding MarR family transcriptional regulator
MTDDLSPLQQELRQTRPFKTPGHEALVGLIRTAAVIQRRLDQAIAPAGISAQQYNVLRILRGAGNDGLPTLAIRDRLIDLSPGITRLVDRLEHKGLLTRARCTPDRRQVLCRITEAGLALLASLDSVVDQAELASVAALDSSEQQQLTRLLDRIRAAG